MRNSKNIKMKLAVLATVAGLALYSSGAMAATQTEIANISFDTAISFSAVTAINFGIVSALNASTYKIDTTGAVTVPVGTGAWLGGTKNAGSITISGSATQTIAINTNNYVVNNGVTPSAATCAYNAGAEVACTGLTAQAAPGAGKVLLLGVSVAASGTQAASSSAAPTFDVVVTYG